jgi:glycosyltransferase involved in cell wall biosynthesis
VIGSAAFVTPEAHDSDHQVSVGVVVIPNGPCRHALDLEAVEPRMTQPAHPSPVTALPSTLPGGKAWPRISIVTPSFGQGAFIEETILSVLNQGYPSVEHIVIDGGSKDGTAAVLDRYRDRLAYAVSEPDRGQSHAINKGMARATGEILTWLNSDDRLAPGALAAMAMAFHTSGADMVAGICELWRDNQMLERHLTSCDDGVLPLDELLDLDGCWNAGQFFYQPEVFFTRGIWEKAGGRVDEESYYSMDYELWLRFAAAGAQLKVIGRAIAKYRVHDGQKTANPQLFRDELPKVRDRFLKTRGVAFDGRASRPIPDRPARVVFFNDLGVQYGAGIAHGRLAEAMRLGGHDVAIVAASSRPLLTAPSADEQEELLGRIGAAEPDVVVVGNVHSASLPPVFLDGVAARWPTAFVAHDLWIATGRCAYTKGCEKLLNGCDASCPTPTEYPPLAPALIKPAWLAKHRLAKSPHSPLLLANSEWTRGQIARALQSDAVETITYGLPDDFVTADPQECRRFLGLPERAFLILLSATSTSDPRKGRAELLQALSLLNLPDVELLLVGHSEDDVAAAGLRVHRLSYQDDPKTLAMIYAAADIFVGPSLEECLGQVFLEAAACGVPSIGFAVGGVPEAVLDGITGLLAREVTPEALAAAITRMYRDRSLRDAMSAWARIAIENERTLEQSYHRMHVVLRRSLRGGDRIFGRKITLRPSSSSAPMERRREETQSVDTWQAVRGFGPWEGPYPEWNLPRCRWQESLVALFHVAASGNGLHTIALRYRNLAADQHLRISCAGADVFAGPVPVSGGHRDSVLTFETNLTTPVTLVNCEASSSSRSPDGRSLVLLICGVDVSRGARPTPSLKDLARSWRGVLAWPTGLVNFAARIIGTRIRTFRSNPRRPRRHS